MRDHSHQTMVRWTGDAGLGTASYAGYRRDHEIMAPGKPTIAGSSAPSFRGDATRWNPEDLIVAALSACHQLWYLHLCADAGVIVVAYEDVAEGVLDFEKDGGGRFREIVLHPLVTIAAGSDPDQAQALHVAASHLCFVERSLACAVRHEAEVRVAD